MPSFIGDQGADSNPPHGTTPDFSQVNGMVTGFLPSLNPPLPSVTFAITVMGSGFNYGGLQATNVRIGSTSSPVYFQSDTIAIATFTGGIVAGTYDVVLEFSDGSESLAPTQLEIPVPVPLLAIDSVVGAPPGGPGVLSAGGTAVITGTGFLSIGGGIFTVDVGGEPCGYNGGTLTETHLDIFANVTPIGPSTLTVHFNNSDTATFPNVSIV